MPTCKHLLIQGFLSYIAILFISLILSYLRSPSPSLLSYAPLLLITLTIIIANIYLTIRFTITKNTMIYVGLVMCVIFVHAGTSINILTQQQNELYDAFNRGNSRWIGYTEYQRESYHLNTIKNNPSLKTPILELNNCVYAMHSWLANHTLFYGLLSIAFRSIGYCSLVFIIIVLVLNYCSTNGRCMLVIWMFMVLMLVLCWLSGDGIKLLYEVNNHNLCLDDKWSSGSKMIVNTSTVEKVKGVALYGDLCQILDPYLGVSRHIDLMLCWNVFYLFYVGCLWLNLHNIISILNGRTPHNYEYLQSQ